MVFDTDLMSNVSYVPDLGANLFSISVLDDKGYFTSIYNRQIKVYFGQELWLFGYRHDKLYKLNIKTIIDTENQRINSKIPTQQQPFSVSFMTNNLKSNLQLWHE